MEGAASRGLVTGHGTTSGEGKHPRQVEGQGEGPMNDDPAVGPIFQKHCPRCSAWNEATVDRLPRDGTTKPTVCEIDLYIPAECPFRENRKNVANHQHPNHKHRIDRRSPKLWIIRRKLGRHP